MRSPRTVGVAPGTFTIQLGAPCPPDEPSSGAPGVPILGWYDSIVPQANAIVAENPYGTQSMLKGLRASLPVSTTTAVVVGAVGFIAAIGFLYIALGKGH